MYGDENEGSGMEDQEVGAELETIMKAMHSHDLDMELLGTDAVLTIDGRRLERPWAWVTPGPSMKQRFHLERTPPGALLLSGRIPTILADLARTRGNWYADSLGNMYVRAPGVLVDVRGRRGSRNTPAKPGSVRPAPTTNLMSARRAQVIFCLLTWPELATAPVRYIAHVAGVSSSLAHLVMDTLQESRYLTPGRQHLEREDELIDQWAAAYEFGLARSLELGRFEGVPSAEEWVNAGHTIRLSGEQAAPELRNAEGLTFYVAEMDMRAALRSHWRRADETANIIVRRKFWTEPEIWGQAAPLRADLAPPLLVYADLLASADPRQREVADAMRGNLARLRSR